MRPRKRPQGDRRGRHMHGRPPRHLSGARESAGADTGGTLATISKSNRGRERRRRTGGRTIVPSRHSIEPTPARSAAPKLRGQAGRASRRRTRCPGRRGRRGHHGGAWCRRLCVAHPGGSRRCLGRRGRRRLKRRGSLCWGRHRVGSRHGRGARRIGDDLRCRSNRSNRSRKGHRSYQRCQRLHHRRYRLRDGLGHRRRGVRHGLDCRHHSLHHRRHRLHHRPDHRRDRIRHALDGRQHSLHHRRYRLRHGSNDLRDRQGRRRG